MKKLFALLVVAGMVFVSCGNQPEAVVDAEATEQVEETIEAVEEQPAAEMTEATEETVEESAE